MNLNRRHFLQTTAAWLALQATRSIAQVPGKTTGLQADPFTMGVASGEPTPAGVVLWTRLGPEPRQPAAWLGIEAIPVRWEIARDEAMRHVVQKGVVSAEPELGHSVHVEVDGLSPASTYFYRFHAGGATSAVGRTRTAPRLTDPQQRMRFAFASCQHYEYGYFNAHKDMAQQELDAVVFLGDYIYEYHLKSPVRRHDLDVLISLSDYRHQYAQYRTDPDLQACHAAHPWIVTLDDHEVENNWAGEYPQWRSPQPDFRARRSAAFQAYYENMPLRRSSLPVGDGMQIYRKLPYGKLAQFTVLDTRQFRTRQPCGDDFKPSCEARLAPEATMMGSQQETWLDRELRTSPATWNILANQVMVAQLKMPNGSDIQYNMDQWDGYPAARKRLLDTLSTVVKKNPVLITGDFHQTWVGRIKRDFDDESSPVIASELVGTSITSGGDGVPSGPHAVENKAANSHLLYNNDKRGYFLCELTQDRMVSQLRTVAQVSQAGAATTTAAEFVSEAGRPGIQQES